MVACGPKFGWFWCLAGDVLFVRGWYNIVLRVLCLLGLGFGWVFSAGLGAFGVGNFGSDLL